MEWRVSDRGQKNAKHYGPVQFTLRLMMVATAVVAVLLALLVPYLKHFPADAVKAIAWPWLRSLGFFSVALALLVWSWMRHCRLAGELRYAFPTRKVSWGMLFWTSWVGAAFFFACYVSWSALERVQEASLWTATGGLAVTSSTLETDANMLNGLAMIPSLLAATCLYYFLRLRYSFFCANGVIFEGQFVPWRDIVSDEWSENVQEVRLTRYRRRGLPLRFSVPAEERQRVEEVLAVVRPKYHGAVNR